MTGRAGYVPPIADPAFLDVAFVCTGNRFRSPLAAALFEKKTAGLPVRVSSLGLLDLGAVPALPEAVKLAQAFGLDLLMHRARGLEEAELEPVGLVLGFEQSHVHAAIVDGRAAVQRTFILPELVALLQDLSGSPSGSSPTAPVERARARIQEADDRRRAERGRTRVPEIADPLGRRLSEQRRTAEQIHSLVSELAEGLFG